MGIDPKLYQALLTTFDLELKEQHQAMVEALIQLENTDQDNLDERLATLFRISHNIKGAAKSVSINQIASIAHALEDLFSIWREDKHIPSKKEIDECLIEADKMITAQRDFLEGEKKKEDAEHIEIAPDEGLKISASLIDKANSKANEFVNFKMHIENIIKMISNVNKEMLELNQSHQLNQLAPLLKQMTRLKDSSNQLLNQYSRSLQTLQDVLQSMRLVSASHVLIPLNRTVRDISQSLHKSVQLKVDGGDIEIDKGILDLLKDPLIHLVRNAIDHGIESDETRKELGKPIPATIHIKVKHQSGKIIIILEDDGSGIDIRKLKHKALKQGLYTQAELTALTDEEAIELIYHSGLSTEENVTEYSGRGVGLDAVKEHIKKMKGSIEVFTTPKKSTRFKLTLPLSLATTRGLIIKQNEFTFMLPTLSLDRLYSISIRDLKEVNNEHTFVIKDSPIPVKCLAGLLDINASAYDPNQKYPAILIGDQNNRILVLIDEILNEHDCVVYPLPAPLDKLTHYIGVINTGQTDLMLVLDPSKLLDVTSTKGFLSFQADNSRIESTVDTKDKRILIVDDSLTTRTIAINTLNAVGFKTKTAVNGQQAWDIIQKQDFDCIVTDIQMPKMNGFELTKKIKKDKELANIPVIMITSLDSEADREKGLSAGANAYLVKKEFDSNKLIDTIRTFL